MAARLLVLIVVLVLICASPTAATAHAVVLSTDPLDGAVLETAPSEVRIVFNEAVQVVSVQVVEPGGSASPIDATLINGATIEARMPKELSSGSHAVSWRVVSSDGHPISGSILFSVGAPSAEFALPGRDRPLDVAIWLTRALFYAGLFIGAGGAAFGGWAGVVPARAKATITAALIGGIAAAIAGVGLQGADTLGDDLGGIAVPDSWFVGSAAGFGLQALLGATTMIAALLELRREGSRDRFVSSLAILALVGATIAATGHASTADPQWLTRPAAFLHASTIAFWIGSLVPLSFVLVDSNRQPLLRFSQVIPLGVLALLASGITLTVVQLGSPSSEWVSPYGAILLVKLGLVAAVLVLALRNRYLFTRPALANDAIAARDLRRSIIVETALVILILLAVSGWRFTPPPRALAEIAFSPASTFGHWHLGEAMADLALEPIAEEQMQATVKLSDPAGQPLAAREVSLSLSEPSLGIEPLRRAGISTTQGVWVFTALNLPAPGVWQVTIDVLVSDFRAITFEGQLVVKDER